MTRNPAASSCPAGLILALLLGSPGVVAQQANGAPQPASPTADTELNRHLDELTSKLDSMRQQLIESQNEMDELRNELRGLRRQLAEKDQTETAAADAAALRNSVEQIEEQTELLQAEVKQHDQTKVETSSKFPVRINGALLLTSIFNSASVDDANLPIVALPPPGSTPRGSLSESASQTMLGLVASGPHLWGGRGYGDLSVDFWGGAPSVNYGAARLRTAHARLDWTDRSLGVAIDRPLLSPWEPSSWVTLAEPALAWSGNLWTWSPQLVFRQKNILHHFDVDMGLIDPPAPGFYTQGQSSVPNASERSRQPGYESRIGFDASGGGGQIHVGAGGYFSRQSYSYDHSVHAWAVSGDWNAMLDSRLQFSGEVYRGQAIGGLGGGAFKDYVSNAAEQYLEGLDAAGGWAQAKFTFTPTLEANVSAGLDNAYASELRDSDQAASQGNYAGLTRNATLIANMVYRPKTYFLLSTEFRQIDSRFIAGQGNRDRVFGVATGYIF